MLYKAGRNGRKDCEHTNKSTYSRNKPSYRYTEYIIWSQTNASKDHVLERARGKMHYTLSIALQNTAMKHRHVTENNYQV